MTLSDIPALPLLRTTWKKWRSDNASGMAAALAYYTLFAIVPLVILGIAASGMILGEAAARFTAETQIERVLGADVAQFIVNMSGASRNKNILAGALSIGITIFGALGAVGQLRLSLDKIWNAPAERRIKAFWKRILPSAGTFLFLGLLGLMLLGSTILTSFAGAALRHLPELQIPGSAILYNLLGLLIGSWIFFIAAYKLLPSVVIKTRDVLYGAAVTALLFTLGNILIGAWFRFKSPGSLYGTASAVIILLLWVYYSAQIFYFGAELTYIQSLRKKIKA